MPPLVANRHRKRELLAVRHFYPRVRRVVVHQRQHVVYDAPLPPPLQQRANRVLDPPKPPPLHKFVLKVRPVNAVLPDVVRELFPPKRQFL